MKKILSAIFAGLLVVLAISCNKDEKVMFDPSDVTAPVLGTVTVDSDLLVDYTPAVFSMDFNKQMPVYHTLGLVSVNGEKCNVTLTNAKDKGSSITLSAKNLNAALMNRGFAYGDNVSLEIVVRASIQDPSKGVTNGYVDSKDSYVFDWTLDEPVDTGGDPYAAYKEVSTWSVIGSIASTGNSWGQDEVMYTDGTWHVAKSIVLTITDQFKFRKDAGWDTNFGAEGDEEPFVVELGTEYTAAAGGKNLAVPADGTYDLWLNPEEGLFRIALPMAGGADPYAEFTEASAWSVIGSIASTGNSWGQDEPMVTDGTLHVCRGLVLTTTDQFKFRKDAGWDTNFGAEGDVEPFVVELDTEYSAAAGGKNLAVPADGKYDLILNPEEATYKVIVAQESTAADPYASYTDDSDWSVIGSIASTGNSWGQDEAMVTDGEWHVCKALALASSDQFKFRKDGKWDTNFGAEGDVEPFVVTLDEEYTAAAGGKNLSVPEDGVYDLLLNPDEEIFKIIKSVATNVTPVTPPTPPAEPSVDGVWTLVGSINGWTVDAGLETVDYGSWKLVQNVQMGFYTNDNGEQEADAVKFVMDGSWDVNFGLAAEFEGLDVEMDAKFNGANIVVGEEGSFDFYLDPQAKKIKVTAHSEEPSTEYVKVYVDNQTGMDAINIWTWDAFGSIVAGYDWPGVTISDTEEVDGKTWNVIEVDAAKVKGKKCSFLICSTDGSWQTKDFSFTADETSLAYYFIAHAGESKEAEIEQITR